MSDSSNRRDFTKVALASAAVGGAPTSARAGRIIGANDRVLIGCITVGFRGVQVRNAFLTQKDAQIVALCDVYERFLSAEAEAPGLIAAGLVRKDGSLVSKTQLRC